MANEESRPQLYNKSERPYLFIWSREFDFPVNTTRSQQSTVKNVDTIGGHDDFDVLCRFETVQLIQQL